MLFGLRAGTLTVTREKWKNGVLFQTIVPNYMVRSTGYVDAGQ